MPNGATDAGPGAVAVHAADKTTNTAHMLRRISIGLRYDKAAGRGMRRCVTVPQPQTDETVGPEPGLC